MVSDLVSRKAALDEIDKNRRTLLSLGMNVEEYVLFHYCRRVIEDLPTIDAVPVVRCKDCKHWDKTWTNDWSPDYHYCPMIDGVRKGDFYCADAERRTDE